MNGISATVAPMLHNRPIAKAVDNCGQAVVNKQIPLESDEDIVTFLRSADYPEIERQFRQDLAVVRKACDYDSCFIEQLDWFEKKFLEYRWPLRGALSLGFNIFWTDVKHFVQYYPSKHENPREYDQRKSIVKDQLCLLYSRSSYFRDVLNQTFAACDEAVFPEIQTDSIKSGKVRLCQKFSCNADSCNLLTFATLPATDESVYSILDDFYFWVEARNGQCRQPALNDLLSINFAACSPKAFTTLAKQAINHTLPEEGAALLQCFEHTWTVNGRRSDLFSDDEIVLAIRSRLEQLPDLRASFAQAIKIKKRAVTANHLLMFCLNPEMSKVAQAYLQNQIYYSGWFFRVGIKASVKDKLINLPTQVLKQFDEEFFTHDLGKYDRQALIQHHLGDEKNSDLEFAIRIMEFEMEGDAELTSSSGVNVLGCVASNSACNKLMPRLHQLKGINPNQLGKPGCLYAGKSALTHYIEEWLPVNNMDHLLTFPGMDVNHQNAQGLTPLMLAAQQVDPEYVKRLLKLPEIQENVNLQDNKGYTALMHACQPGFGDNYLCFTRLVQTKGIDLNCQDKHCKTALMLASECGFADRLQILLEQNGLEKDRKDQDGNTALMLAIIKRKQDWEQCIDLLIESGVDLSCCNKAGQDAYQLARKYCYKDHQVIKLLQ